MKTAASLFLTFLFACTGTGLVDGQSAAAKADKLIGLALTYADQPQTPESQAELAKAIVALAGVDAAALDTIVPTGTGIALADKLVAKQPALEPFHDLIAKAYTYIMFGAAQ